MNKILLSSVIVLTILFVGCSARNLENGADSVIISTKSKADYNKCTFLGKIYGKRIHSNNTLFLSSKEFQQDDVNFLKNEGKKLGANIVVFQKHKIVKSYRRGIPKSAIDVSKYHDVYGDAYFCPKA